MSPNSATASRSTVRAVLAAGIACLISGLTVAFAALLPSASADHDEDPLLIVKDGDHPGGNATCEEFDLVPLFPNVEGAVGVDNAFVTATVSGGGTILDVVAKDGFIITAVIVKGSDASNVYFMAPFHDMQAPLNNGGQVAQISHYIVCGSEGDETTTSGNGGTTTSGNGETTSGNGETTSGNGETTTPPGEELPKTGSANGWLAALGAGLLLGGAGLVLAGRQAGRHQA
jgi:LPXTG-motif cell wall-anchored protein